MAHNQGMDMKQVNTSEDWEIDVVLKRYNYALSDENRKNMKSLIQALGKDLHDKSQVLNRAAIYKHFDNKWPSKAPKK